MDPRIGGACKVISGCRDQTSDLPCWIYDIRSIATTRWVLIWKIAFSAFLYDIWWTKGTFLLKDVSKNCARYKSKNKFCRTIKICLLFCKIEYSIFSYRCKKFWWSIKKDLKYSIDINFKYLTKSIFRSGTTFNFSQQRYSFCVYSRENNAHFNSIRLFSFHSKIIYVIIL